jgi:hypothetical protein
VVSRSVGCFMSEGSTETIVALMIVSRVVEHLYLPLAVRPSGPFHTEPLSYITCNVCRREGLRCHLTPTRPFRARHPAYPHTRFKTDHAALPSQLQMVPSTIPKLRIRANWCLHRIASHRMSLMRASIQDYHALSHTANCPTSRPIGWPCHANTPTNPFTRFAANHAAANLLLPPPPHPPLHYPFL